MLSTFAIITLSLFNYLKIPTLFPEIQNNIGTKESVLSGEPIFILAKKVTEIPNVSIPSAIRFQTVQKIRE